MSPTVINWITNVLGALVVLGDVAKQLASTGTWSWAEFGMSAVLALVAYFTGKGAIHVQSNIKPSAMISSEVGPSGIKPHMDTTEQP